MLFSEYFKISADRITFFDPNLTRDTKLFIDPFLVFKNEFAQFAGSHKELIEFFNRAYKLAASAKEDDGETNWQNLLQMLCFPEPPEFCLGYTSKGVHGAGSGPNNSKKIAKAMKHGYTFGPEKYTPF